MYNSTTTAAVSVRAPWKCISPHVGSNYLNSMIKHPCTLLTLAILSAAVPAFGAANITAERHGRDEASAGFKFPKVPAPSRGDAGAKAKFTVVDGERDPNGGDLATLNDGKLPKSADEPSANFFFRAGSDGGRIVVDLGSPTNLHQINTYSWHANTRAAQVYRLYASDGTAAGFDAAPKRPTEPEKAGWTLLANVDTRAKENPPGEQHGVSISGAEGKTSARYLLFDFMPTEKEDAFGNTFYSEIDILDRERNEADEPPAAITDSVEIEGTPYRFTIETTEAPDLTEWARRDLIPVMKEWYPKIVEMLPSEGYIAPRNFSITFTDSYRGVAATMGNRVVGSPAWYRRNLKGEAIGSLVHELVHVVQQYRGRRREGGTRPPGWLIEGVPDYIRWYLYEPQSRGAEIRPGSIDRARYDGSYRVSANFLNFVIGKYDKELIKELNAAMREGRYDPEIWKTRTKKSVEELADEWKQALKDAAATPAPAPAAAGQ